MPRISQLPQSNTPQEGDLIPVLVNATNTTSKVTLATIDQLTGQQIYNVLGYGAKGDGTTDDTTAIQSAINAAAVSGGIVYFPTNTYLISSALTLSSYVTLRGASDAFGASTASTIKQSSTTLNALYYSKTSAGLTNCTIENLRIVGPNSGSGNGIYLKTSGTAKPHINITLRNLTIYGFGATGINIEQMIVSVLERITTLNCTNGFLLNGDAAASSTYNSVNTSTTLISCYADGCPSGYGFKISYSTYITMQNCAADSCGTAYWLLKCNCITLNSCGSEWGNPDTASPGDGFKIDGCQQCTLNSPYTYQNFHYSFYVTNSSTDIALIGSQENSPVSATKSFKSDSGTGGSIIGLNWTTSKSDAGKFNYLNDGTGGFTTADYAYLNSTLTVAGTTSLTNLSTAIASTGTNFTLGKSNSTLLVSTTASISLPTAIGITGAQYTVKNTGGGTVTILPASLASVQTIDGNSLINLSTKNAVAQVQSDGSNWWVLSQAVATIGLL